MTTTTSGGEARGSFWLWVYAWVWLIRQIKLRSNFGPNKIKRNSSLTLIQILKFGLLHASTFETSRKITLLPGLLASVKTFRLINTNANFNRFMLFLRFKHIFISPKSFHFVFGRFQCCQKYLFKNRRFWRFFVARANFS